MPVIDIHTHLFSANKPMPQAALRDPMWDVSDRLPHPLSPGFRARAETQALPRIEQYLERMDAWGIDMVCINNVALTSDGARAMNDFNAEIIADHPTRMMGFAAAPMAEGEKGARELEYAVKQLGFRGCKIYPKIQGVPLDAPSARPLYEAAADLNVPILTHTTAMPQLYSGYRGVPWQDHTADNPARMFDSGLLRDIPNLKIIFAHQAGGYVYFIKELIARNPDIGPLFDRFYVDMSPGIRFSEAQVRAAIDALGVDHVLWGIDYPWAPLEQCGPCVSHFQTMGLPDDVKRDILGNNAAKLLNLPA